MPEKCATTEPLPPEVVVRSKMHARVQVEALRTTTRRSPFPEASPRLKAADWLYVALRGDRFWENVASRAAASAAPIFWPTKWVSSGTATLDVRPAPDNLSVRLEYRHDQADGDMYFRGTVTGDGSSASPFVPNTNHQDTLTLGATARF